MEVAPDGDLHDVARAVLADLEPGEAVHLVGPVGAGKTTLVQACGAELGTRDPITSPTFALAHRYRTTGTPLVHLDLYRLRDQPQRDTDELLDELERGDAIAFVEWPEAGAGWLPEPVRVVRIDVRPDGTRRFAISPRRAPST